MSTIVLEDLKLRVFVDTNVLVDCFVTTEQPVADFVKAASENDSWELVTSDYAMWEQNEFIRKHTWIKYLVNNGKSHKAALSYKLKLPEELRKQVAAEILNAKVQREALNILNYNLMDEATLNGDFFTLLELLTIHSTISNQDLLILLSAYATKSKGILTKDGYFDTSVSEVAGLEEALGTSLLPPVLKSVCFIKNINKTPQHHYAEWFERTIVPKSIGECINVYPQPNVVGVECIADNEIEVGDYLMIAKVDNDHQVNKVVFRVDESSLQDYDTEALIAKSRKVTIKLPPEIVVRRWKKAAKVFKIETN